MVVSLANLPGSDLPLAFTPAGKPCSRLAVIFHWKNSERRRANINTSEQSSGRMRTFSASLAMEMKIMEILDIFAIVPTP